MTYSIGNQKDTMGYLGQGRVSAVIEHGSNITASEGRRKTYETSTMGRRVTNFTTLEHRQLTLDPLSSLLCRSDDVQSTNTFAI